jgi:hypothetical protein
MNYKYCFLLLVGVGLVSYVGILGLKSTYYAQPKGPTDIINTDNQQIECSST